MKQRSIHPASYEKGAAAPGREGAFSTVGNLAEQDMASLNGGACCRAVMKRELFENPVKIVCKCGAIVYVSGNFKTVTCPRCGKKLR